MGWGYSEKAKEMIGPMVKKKEVLLSDESIANRRHGFLGSNLLRHLCIDGYEVAALKRRSSCLDRVREFEHDAAWYDADEIDLALPFQRHGHFDAVIMSSTCYGRKKTSLLLYSLSQIQPLFCVAGKSNIF